MFKTKLVNTKRNWKINLSKYYYKTVSSNIAIKIEIWVLKMLINIINPVIVKKLE